LESYGAELGQRVCSGSAQAMNQMSTAAIREKRGKMGGNR